MHFSISMLGVLAMIFSLTPITANGNELEDRCAGMIAELSDRRDQYSVDYAVLQLASVSTTQGEAQSVVEIVGHKAADNKKNFFRLDSYSSPLGEMVTDSWEHILQRENERWFASAEGRRDRLRVAKLPKEAKLRSVPWMNFDFYVAGLSGHEGSRVYGGFDYLQSFLRYEQVKGLEVDGRFIGVFVSKNRKGVLLLDFAEKPRWAPVRARRFLARTGRFDTGIDAFEQLGSDDWLLFSDTRTAWKQTDDGIWAPATVRMLSRSQRQGGEDREVHVELRFENWTFGDSFPAAEFDSKQFSEQALINYDFERIRKGVAEANR